MTEEKRKPGRPKRTPEPDRPERIPLGHGQKLKLPNYVKNDPDWDKFEYRWCEDNQIGSIDDYLSAWWEFVKKPSGENDSRPSGNGNNRLILMRLPKEIYQKDMELQESRNVDTLHREVGELAPDEYIPGDRKFVVSRDM